MTAHRLINITLTAGLTAALAAILLAGPVLDDHSAEWNHSTALRDAQQQAQAEARRERAAQHLCVRLRGPHAAHRWTEAGELTCVGTRGQAVSVAKVAL